MHSNDPLFSIIIPCYNSERYVKASVESIINQTYGNFEIVAIDDGSTDATLNILNLYSSMDKRVKVFHKENGGYATAINYGLDRIKGDYFLMMGSDDKLSINLLENIVKIVKISTFDMLVYKVKMHWTDNNKNDEIDPYTLFNKEIDYKGNYASFSRLYKYEAYYFGLRDTGKVYKREILGNLRYFGHYGFDADGIFALLFSHKCASFFVMPIEGYIWNIRDGSLSGRKLSISTHLDRLSNWTSLVKSLEKMPKEELAEIDYSYSKIGTNIINYIEYNARRTFIKKYFLICNYYYHLRSFWIKKRGFKSFGIKMLLNSFFPFSFFLISTFKRFIKL